jgi:hypothetical protein
MAALRRLASPILPETALVDTNLDGASSPEERDARHGEVALELAHHAAGLGAELGVTSEGLAQGDPMDLALERGVEVARSCAVCQRRIISGSSS